ncbi:hypothetical protein R3P38DRAFT_2923447 [Favolaschia claudopus]|uniref:J domain-containing protein n=1 Tax=Favolaschia claudopus TaxID=2862362 RepID=A0AAW0BWX4_9AGAR
MDSPTSFYDVLDIPRDATHEQIRKAYKKLALQTHPDRLPPGFSDADKQDAEERFREVSNAYEVLKDEKSRQLYDMHGVWPPPEPLQEQPYASRHHFRRHRPFDPFDNSFVDPFEMFDKMFGDYRRPSYRPARHHQRDPFEAMYRLHDMMADMERDAFSFPPRSFSLGFDSPFHNRGFTNFGDPGQMRWASQSTTITTVNGVTHRIEKRRDWEGNEHVTRSYPDGREIHTINGVEQQSRGFLPPPGPPPQDHRNMAPLPPMPPPPQYMNGYISPPPSYHGSRSSGHPGYNSRRESPVYPRERHSSGPVIPPIPSPVIPDMNPRPQRKWWRRRDD